MGAAGSIGSAVVSKDQAVQALGAGFDEEQWSEHSSSDGTVQRRTFLSVALIDAASRADVASCKALLAKGADATFSTKRATGPPNKRFPNKKRRTKTMTAVDALFLTVASSPTLQIPAAPSSRDVNAYDFFVPDESSSDLSDSDSESEEDGGNDVHVPECPADVAARLLKLRERPYRTVPDLARAVSSSNGTTEERYLQRGLHDDETWLLRAARLGHAEELEALLGLSAEDFMSTGSRYDRYEGETSLLVAIRHHHAACVRLLLEAGASLQPSMKYGHDLLQEQNESPFGVAIGLALPLDDEEEEEDDDDDNEDKTNKDPMVVGDTVAVPQVILAAAAHPNVSVAWGRRGHWYPGVVTAVSGTSPKLLVDVRLNWGPELTGLDAHELCRGFGTDPAKRSLAESDIIAALLDECRRQAFAAAALPVRAAAPFVDANWATRRAVKRQLELCRIHGLCASAPCVVALDATLARCLATIPQQEKEPTGGIVVGAVVEHEDFDWHKARVTRVAEDGTTLDLAYFGDRPASGDFAPRRGWGRTSKSSKHGEEARGVKREKVRVLNFVTEAAGEDPFDPCWNRDLRPVYDVNRLPGGGEGPQPGLGEPRTQFGALVWPEWGLDSKRVNRVRARLEKGAPAQAATASSAMASREQRCCDVLRRAEAPVYEDSDAVGRTWRVFFRHTKDERSDWDCKVFPLIRAAECGRAEELSTLLSAASAASAPRVAAVVNHCWAPWPLRGTDVTYVDVPFSTCDPAAGPVVRRWYMKTEEVHAEYTRYSPGYSALYASVLHGHLACAKILLAFGARLGRFVDKPHMYTSAFERSPMLGRAAGTGKDAEIRARHFVQYNNHRTIRLHGNWEREVVATLRGPLPTTVDEPRLFLPATALECAAQRNDGSMVALLMSAYERQADVLVTAAPLGPEASLEDREMVIAELQDMAVQLSRAAAIASAAGWTGGRGRAGSREPKTGGSAMDGTRKRERMLQFLLRDVMPAIETSMRSVVQQLFDAGSSLDEVDVVDAVAECLFAAPAPPRGDRRSYSHGEDNNNNDDNCSCLDRLRARLVCARLDLMSWACALPAVESSSKASVVVTLPSASTTTAPTEEEAGERRRRPRRRRPERDDDEESSPLQRLRRSLVDLHRALRHGRAADVPADAPPVLELRKRIAIDAALLAAAEAAAPDATADSLHAAMRCAMSSGVSRGAPAFVVLQQRFAQETHDLRRRADEHAAKCRDAGTILSLLLEAGCDATFSPHRVNDWACAAGTEWLCSMLRAGADPNVSWSPRHEKDRRRRRDWDGRRHLLVEVTKTCNLAAVRLLLEAGADANVANTAWYYHKHDHVGFDGSSSETSLHVACRSAIRATRQGSAAAPWLRLMRGLLEEGNADPNAVAHRIVHDDRYRRVDDQWPFILLRERETALHMALEARHAPLVALLCVHGADTDTHKTFGCASWSAAQLACGGPRTLPRLGQALVPRGSDDSSPLRNRVRLVRRREKRRKKFMWFARTHYVAHHYDDTWTDAQLARGRGQPRRRRRRLVGGMDDGAADEDEKDDNEDEDSSTASESPDAEDLLLSLSAIWTPRAHAGFPRQARRGIELLLLIAQRQQWPMTRHTIMTVILPLVGSGRVRPLRRKAAFSVDGEGGRIREASSDGEFYVVFDETRRQSDRIRVLAREEMPDFVKMRGAAGDSDSD